MSGISTQLYIYMFGLNFSKFPLVDVGRFQFDNDWISYVLSAIDFTYYYL